MLPYDQYVYNSEGVLETQIFYSNYTTFSAGKYPSKVTIKRPQEGIQLVLSFEAVHENVNAPDSQFEVKIPDGANDQEIEVAGLIFHLALPRILGSAIKPTLHLERNMRASAIEFRLRMPIMIAIVIRRILVALARGVGLRPAHLHARVASA